MGRRAMVVVLLVLPALWGCGTGEPTEQAPGASVEASTPLRNPFGIEVDVPEPDARDVTEFAASVSLDGGDQDVNADDWLEVDATASASSSTTWTSRST